MSQEEPVVRVINRETQHEYRVYASGRIEGFGAATVVINSIHFFAVDEIARYCQARGYEFPLPLKK